MKAGGRLRYFATLTSILAATALAGAVFYQTTFDTLRRSYQQLVERSADQGAVLIEGYLADQFALLSLYASSSSVKGGDFADLPAWLTNPTGHGAAPRRLSILNAAGQGLTSGGSRFDASDRRYFRRALVGSPAAEGPMVSRVDGHRVVVAAVPIPGIDPRARVLTASLDWDSFRALLDSVHGLSGAQLVLRDTSTPGSPASPGELRASRTLDSYGWVLEASVHFDDLVAPIRTILLLVGGLILLAGVLTLVFLLARLRHREDLETVKEDRSRALREAYEQIRRLAFYDTVTRLPNRHLIERRLNEALASATEAVVAVVALGRFRNLSTSFGMAFGDSVLREAAARLTAFAPEDTGTLVGRLGGGEFLLIFPQAVYRPETLGNLLGLFDAPMGTTDLRLPVNVHIGACRIDEADSAEDVIKSAETALWAARESGNHAACELDARAVAARLRRAQLQKLLPEAWTRGEMEVVFQPQVDLQTGRVSGYEALARWTSPELGPVSPMEFIPIAEETGAIVALGYWVLDRGIEFAQGLLEDGAPAVVSVNASAVQFLHHGFLDEVRRRVAASSLPPQWLGLEITESAMLEGVERLRPALVGLMESGMKVSLDDFGTGYSSLNYLKDLPLHTLKIDKCFVQALEDDERAFRLVECIIDLAHHLGLIVVAEGIETARQQELLGEVGCDLLQGYRTGRPAAAHIHRQRSLPDLVTP